jgi:Mrp family chromosome partitioning ATPase
MNRNRRHTPSWARAALATEPDADDEPHGPDEAPAPPDGDMRHVLAAVWGPKGGPGRTTVAVNLAFEAAAAGGEVLLVDADTYGGAVAQAKMQESRRSASRGEKDPPLLGCTYHHKICILFLMGQ